MMLCLFTSYCITNPLKLSQAHDVEVVRASVGYMVNACVPYCWQHPPEPDSCSTATARFETVMHVQFRAHSNA